MAGLGELLAFPSPKRKPSFTPSRSTKEPLDEHSLLAFLQLPHYWLHFFPYGFMVMFLLMSLLQLVSVEAAHTLPARDESVNGELGFGRKLNLHLLSEPVLVSCWKDLLLWTLTILSWFPLHLPLSCPSPYS